MTDNRQEYIEPEEAKYRARKERKRREAIIKATEEQLRSVDPYGRMTLNSIKDPSPKMRVVLAHATRLLDEFGKSEKPLAGIFMSGMPGTGKTHLMVGLMREMANLGIRTSWVNALQFVSEVRDTYGASWDSPTRSQLIARVHEHPVVFLDDLGKEHQSDDVATVLYELIDGLLIRERTLIVSTNLKKSDYERRYDDAVRSRIREMCLTWEVDGVDHRRQQRTRYRT